MEEQLSICLISPYVLGGSHPVAEHVRQTATGLAGRGHKVTVLAPSSSRQALRAGRRRFRSLAGGDAEAVQALPGEPLAIAVGPAVPLGQRRGGVGIPVASRANVAMAVTEGGFDVIDAHEPHVPGIASSAVKHSTTLTAATFHTAVERALVAPLRGSSRERRRANIDALIATGERAAETARRLYTGEYALIPSPIDPAFRPGRKGGGSIVLAWTAESRGVTRALVRLVAAHPEMELTLLWERSGRRPLRPYVPAAARGRVHVASPRTTAERAAVLADADVLVCPAEGGGDSRLAWEGRSCGAVIVALEGHLALAYADDQPALAAAATGCAIADPELREQLTEDGMREARLRSPEAVAEQTEAVYLAMLRRRRRAERRGGPEQTRLIDCDLHMHTRYSHDCATEVDDLLEHCIGLGLGAIAITDHNELAGALEAQRIVHERDLPITVIAGEEVKTAQGEVIGLFLTERIERGLTMADTVAEIQRQGGLVLVPHPFDRMHTIPDAATLHRLLDEIDIFEVYNSRLLFDSFNDEALRFARKYNLIQSAGSDAHVLQGLGTAINRIPAFDGPEEFLVAMRHNQIIRRPRSLLYLQGLKWVAQVSKSS